MPQLRLLLHSACNRSCIGCCNKDWDLGALPVCEDFSGYSMIMLTGGEPMLTPALVIDVARMVRRQTQGKIILYTAMPKELPSVMPFLDGVTLTLHEQPDVAGFLELPPLDGLLRLNVFDGVDLGDADTHGWDVKRGIKWIERCPLPAGEVFMRLDKRVMSR